LKLWTKLGRNQQSNLSRLKNIKRGGENALRENVEDQKIRDIIKKFVNKFSYIFRGIIEVS